MGTIGDKLTYLEETKTAIKNAIIEKGVEVSESIEFREYANKIKEIKSGFSNLKDYLSSKYEGYFVISDGESFDPNYVFYIRDIYNHEAIFDNTSYVVMNTLTIYVGFEDGNLCSLVKEKTSPGITIAVIQPELISEMLLFY